MSYYLEFGPQVKMKNPLNGQFNKGHATWNKGMTWDEMGISPEKQARMRANLSLHRKGRAIGGWNRKAIVAMDDDEHILAWFSSACDAEGKTGICARNIRSCCNGRRKHVGGYRWRFFDELG